MADALLCLKKNQRTHGFILPENILMYNRESSKPIFKLFFQQNFDFFFFCISTCYKWFPTKKHAKIIIAADFGTSGGYTHVKSISVSRNLVMTNELSM